MKKPLTLGPEGLEMLNEKGERVFFIECVDGAPLMNFSKDGARLSVLPQPWGFSIEYSRGDALKIRIYEDGIQVHDDTGKPIGMLSFKDRLRSST
jgi:hypothetical protein